MTPAPATPRHAGLDALRGLLMAAVVIGHFPTSRLGVNPFGALPEWLYFFHIPLFLALSCLFVKPATLARTWARARQLLVPYGFWFILAQPRQALDHPLALLGDAAMGNWSHVHSSLWFLPALFTANLLVALGRTRAGRRNWAGPGLGVLGIAAFLGAPHLANRHPWIPFGADVALFLLPFVWGIGQVWRHRAAICARAGAWLLPAALAALALGGLLARLCERVKTHSEFARRVDFAQFSVPETMPGYLGMFLMAAALVLLAHRLEHAPGAAVRRCLEAAGQASLPIYLLHYPLLFVLTRTIGVAGEARGWLLLYGLAVTVLVLALPMLLAWGLGRLSPRFALVGLLAARPAQRAGEERGGGTG